MEKSTRLAILAVCILLFAFEITNIAVSNNELSGNYVIAGVTKVEKRSIRLGATTDFNLVYPIVITFQDLILLMTATFLLFLVVTDGKKIEFKLKKPKEWLIISLIISVLLWICLSFQLFYRFEFGLFNEWSIYYLLHFAFMCSLIASFLFAYLLGKKTQIKLFKEPKIEFMVLVGSLLTLGLLIGIFDAVYTGRNCEPHMIFNVSNLIIYWLTMFGILGSMFLSTVLFTSLSNNFKLKDKNLFTYLFSYAIVYSTGLWFLTWHWLSDTLLPEVQHPLPFRIYPFALYWESWMDYWLMVVTIIFFLILSYMIYKRKFVGKK